MRDCGCGGSGTGGSGAGDSAISRLLHAVNRPAEAIAAAAASVSASASASGMASAPPEARTGALTAEERLLAEAADRYLSDGLSLLRWWRQADARGGYTERFELERTFNRSASSYGFFGVADLDGRAVPVMGNVQEMMYDNPRVPARLGMEITDWIRDQVREFVLRYFMRVSDFRHPEVAGPLMGPPPPPGLGRFTWCATRDVLREGFGFTQLLYKRRGSGAIGRFGEHEASAIIDLRELGRTYEWIIAKVRIFDFDVTFRPFGETGPEIIFTLNEESYLVLSRDLITNRDDPEPGVLGDYAFGYAFIKTERPGFLAYGPGRFEAAVEVIRFRVLADGQIRVHMLFVANRPTSIASVSIDPIDWSVWTLDWLSDGGASRLFAPLRDTIDRRPLRLGTVDPIYAYVSLANVLSGGGAARQLCISRDALDKQFLVQHFKQHYDTIVGSLLTWRQIPDWTDASALPAWILQGASA